MKQTTKSKLYITPWILSLGFNFLSVENQCIGVWEKWIIMICWLVIIALNIKRINEHYKDLTLIDDILIVRDTFKKEKQYNLKTVLSWTENHYQCMGFNTGSEIILRTSSGIKINLWGKKSEGFEKLSDYLNENLSDKYEN